VTLAGRYDNQVRYRSDVHPNQAQLTPSYVLEPIRAALGGIIELDPCTEPSNPTDATRFFCLPADGAAEPWDEDTIYVNPPYGVAKDRWVSRCIAAGTAGKRVAILIPAHPETKTFQLALASADATVFIAGRLLFGLPRKDGREMAASHGSTLFTWAADLEPLRPLGQILRAA
jgi:hypothetical protein